MLGEQNTASMLKKEHYFILLIAKYSVCYVAIKFISVIYYYFSVIYNFNNQE